MRLSLFLISLVCSFISAQWVRADDFEDLKQSVRRRNEAIQVIKSLGVAREDASGRLVPESEITPEQQRLLEDENADRGRLFDLIARRTEATPGEVAARFASRAGIRGEPKPPPPPPPPDTTGPPPPDPGQPMPSTRTKALPMKVITRPFSTLYASAAESAQKVRENVPGFTIFYVYRQEPGWYQVGANTSGEKLAWLKAADGIEWKQNLVVEFTHPENRQPVLLFNELEVLQNLAAAPHDDRARQAQDLLRTIQTAKKLPRGFPVRSMEPARASDRRRNFYLLPIVDFREVEFDGRPGRLLQLAAAARSRGELALEEKRFDWSKPADLDGAKAREAKVDVVFVMDLTRSMGPFLDRTIEMIQKCVNQVGNDPQAASALRFGFWGYRDFPEVCPEIEFNTRNFTPELQDVTSFARTIGGIVETKIDSVDYEEDVFAGVHDALTKTAWREGALRLMVLVGDAPGRAPGQTGVGYPKGPRGTKSNTDPEALRALATERNVFITALYLRVPKWAEFAPAGGTQFRALARNPNARPGLENYRMLAAPNTDVYAATGTSLADGFVRYVRFTQGQEKPPGEIPDDQTNPDNPVETPDAGRNAGRQLADNMFRGAMVKWLGTENPAEMPRDVTAWAADKDLADPVIESLEAKVLLTKRDLNTLKLRLDTLINGAIRDRVTNEGFLKSIKSIIAAGVVDPTRLEKADTIRDTGLLPEFLKDLPYRSSIMDLGDEAWMRLGPDLREQKLQHWLTKLEFYRSTHDDTAAWVPLNPNDDRDNHVAAIPLSQLP